jgi:hypothetical protein
MSRDMFKSLHTKADIYIKVRFKTTLEGGRGKAVTGEIYGCPMYIEKNGYDCRLFLEGVTLELGESYEVSVKFLDKESALSIIHIGQHIALWEGKVVAEGEVTRILVS